MIALFLLSVIISWGFIALAVFILYQASPQRKSAPFFTDSDNRELQKLINLAKKVPSPPINIPQSTPHESKKQNLQRQLLLLVNNDIAIAERLLKLERKKHPMYSENWYLKKVINDLLIKRN
jgi:predicted PurR-regulated permease PerM